MRDLVEPPERRFPGDPKYCDACPDYFLSLKRIWEGLNTSYPRAMSHRVQNIGANDGISSDPVYSLISAHRPAALLLEASAETFKRLQANML